MTEQRLTPERYAHMELRMEVDPSGDYVSYEDYAAIKAEIEHQKEQHELSILGWNNERKDLESELAKAHEDAKEALDSQDAIQDDAIVFLNNTHAGQVQKLEDELKEVKISAAHIQQSAGACEHIRLLQEVERLKEELEKLQEAVMWQENDLDAYRTKTKQGGCARCGAECVICLGKSAKTTGEREGGEGDTR